MKGKQETFFLTKPNFSLQRLVRNYLPPLFGARALARLRLQLPSF